MDFLYQVFHTKATEPRKAIHNWEPDAPYLQPYYVYSASDKRWRGVLPPAKPPTSTSRQSPDPVKPLTKFTVYSWNIDFMLPAGDARLEAALDHLQQLIHTLPSNQSSPLAQPSIILLQEMTNSDLRLIQSQPWIQQSYHLTDISNEFWSSDAYGTCTLISKALVIANVFRVHYKETVMQRDGLFVDLCIDGNSDGDGEGESKGNGTGCLRVCNTHLESLALEPPRRPAQLACAARFMRSSGGDEKAGGAVLGSVLGGDLNAIQDFDKTLHVDNGLQDAYLSMGGIEGEEGGMTWGQMARTQQRERFGLSRMDKLLFCGGVQVERFERFGYGIEASGQKEREELLQQGLDKPWVTDHLGVKGEFTVVGNAGDS